MATPGSKRDFAAWLEGEVLEAKAQVGQARQLLERLQGQLWELGQRLQGLEERQEAQGGQLAGLRQLEDGLRRLPARLERLEEDGALLQERVAGLADLRGGALGRLLQTEEERSRRLVELGERLEGWEGRLGLAEGLLRSSREAQEALTGKAGDLGEELLAMRGQLFQQRELFRHLEERLAQTDEAMEGLRLQNQALAERGHLAGEQGRRLEGRLTELAEEQVRLSQVAERVELVKVEGARHEERLGQAERQGEEQQGRLVALERALAQLGGRSEGLAQQMALLREEMKRGLEEAHQQLARLGQWQERQHRRQLELLEKSLQEYKRYGPQPDQE